MLKAKIAVPGIYNNWK